MFTPTSLDEYAIQKPDGNLIRLSIWSCDFRYNFTRPDGQRDDPEEVMQVYGICITFSGGIRYDWGEPERAPH